MIGSQHLRLKVLAVAARFRVLAAALLTGVTKVFLLAVGRNPVETQAVTTTVVTKKCLRNQDTVYSILPMLDHYHFNYSTSFCRSLAVPWM